MEASIPESTHYRFFIIMEIEVVRQLLLMSTPVTEYPAESQSCSVELFDVEYDAETDDSAWPPDGTEYSVCALVYLQRTLCPSRC
jgi:hypothetical protein